MKYYYNCKYIYIYIIFWSDALKTDLLLNIFMETIMFFFSTLTNKKQSILHECISLRVGVLPRHPGQIHPLASDPHGLLIIPVHWLASSLGLLSTSKLVCGGCSGALWLPSHHPGGCCTLVVDKEISPLLCKSLWVPRKALYKCN